MNLMSFATLKRYRVWAWRLLWQRKVPFGLMSGRFLWGRLSQSQKIHRQVLGAAFPSLPRTIVWMLNVWIWIRWILYHAWRNTYRTVKASGPAVASEHQISLVTQHRQALSLALLHTIPAQFYYQFQLYRPSEKGHWWNYVFNHELPTFHLLNDSATSKSQRQLLSDKLEFETQMTQLKIPVPTSHPLCTSDTYVDVAKFAETPIFCKTRSGNQARGAFRLEMVKGVPHLTMLDGTMLQGDTASEYINTLLSHKDYLVQPCYTNHPALAVLHPACDEPVILRVVTTQHGQQISFYCAYLEVPLLSENYKFYFSVLISITDGMLIRDSLERQWIPDGIDYSAIEQAASHLSVPHWKQILDVTAKAHNHFNAIYSVAWDLLITEKGPVLLEGNSNWRIDLPQQLCGGILANRHSSAG